MLYEALNWHDGGAEARPPLDGVLSKSENARYVADWGRAGDVALCALDRRDEPVGAAWYRRFSAGAPGYGYVADDVPELAIAVYPEFRRQHVGSLLLERAARASTARRRTRDQPERQPGESVEAAVRETRIRSRRGAGRRIDDAARIGVTTNLSPPPRNGSKGSGPGPGDGAPPPRHAHWEFRALTGLVALMAIGIILAWTLIGSKSPERLDSTSASHLSGACADAQAQLKALPNSAPRTGADRVARLRAENAILRAMIGRFGDVRPRGSTPAAAVRGWSSDWTDVVDARQRYADALERTRTSGDKVQFVLPAGRGLKPVTQNMDDFVRENHPNLTACFTQRLELETVEGARVYADVTE